MRRFPAIGRDLVKKPAILEMNFQVRPPDIPPFRLHWRRLGHFELSDFMVDQPFGRGAPDSRSVEDRAGVIGLHDLPVELPGSFEIRQDPRSETSAHRVHLSRRYFAQNRDQWRQMVNQFVRAPGYLGKHGDALRWLLISFRGLLSCSSPARSLRAR